MTNPKIQILLCIMFAVSCGDTVERDCGVVDGEPAFAVVLSDFQSTSIGLLDASADLLTECWIDSGTRGPGLVAALSGDVVLATDQAPGSLTVIDRFGTDVYSRVGLDTPEVLGQVRLQDSEITGAFSANPHDAVIAGPRSVWVSRYAASADEDAPPLGRGSDLLEIDPTTFDRTGARISLEDFIAPVAVPTDDGMVIKRAFPRPSRMVRVGDTVIVGVSRLTLEFDGAAPGAVAVVDLPTRTARLYPLPDGVTNCGRVAPVPGRTDRVAVGCSGFSRPFDVEQIVRQQSGVFMLQVEGSTVSTALAWRPGPSSPLAVAEIVAVDATSVAGVAYGRDGPDSFHIIDLETGTTEQLFESRGAFEIGAGTVGGDGLLLVPDASAGVRRWASTPTGYEALPSLPLDGGGVGLPPRSVYALRAR